MNNHQLSELHQKINKGVQKAIADAIEKHQKLGESIAVWQDGEVVILPPEKIPTLLRKN
ncbi:MAG: hypothetical protein DSM107014_10120 [Gomphosphaeria aponina SAG 52.96 = DSM 107014]|uniref:Uncharacterized protein n=1 Tax=Gomphosphaeria aponina SAG 52.96 = DSM 107014 TaxID=1521640 RepID=A0A941JV39_9CHRO|nr:hypothetical protein [Gomphosphaeria aponina SAG 52.96 = DSM 107014]